MPDYNAMRLAAHGDPLEMDRILQQECRERYGSKLSRTLELVPDFRFPSLAVAQMSTSDDVAQIHASLVEPGRQVLDMTCGLAIDSMAMARAGAEVTALDIDPANAAAAAHNARSLPNLHVLCADSVRWLEESGRSFHTIFIDPARRDQRGRHVSLADCQPDITGCLPLLRSRCQRLVVKASPMLDSCALRRDLGPDTDIKIIGTRRECKEMLALCPGTGLTECVTLGEATPWSFPAGQEAAATPTFAMPEAGQVLLQPWPAVMKGGSFRLLSSRTGLPMLHPMSHIYLSTKPLTGFPGVQMSILEVLPFGKATIKTFARRWPEVNVAVRNFPLTAPQLAARLKVREGGDLRLIGTTAPDGTRLLILSRPLV